MKLEEQRLVNYVINGEYDLVCKLIKAERVNLNLKNEHGIPLLHLAINHSNIVEYLLDQGVQIDTPDLYGNTALHHAALSGKVDTVKLLIEKGANVNAQNYWRFTPLHLSANHDQIKSIQLLLDSGARINSLNFEEETPIQAIFKSYIANNLSEENRQTKVEVIKGIIAYNEAAASAINQLPESIEREILQNKINELITARESISKLLTKNINRLLSIDELTQEMDGITEQTGREFASNVAKSLAIKILSEPIKKPVKGHITTSDLKAKIQELNLICNAGKIINHDEDYILLPKADSVLRKFCDDTPPCLSLFCNIALTIDTTLLSSKDVLEKVPKEVIEKCICIHNVMDTGSLSSVLFSSEETTNLLGNCD